MNARGAYWCFVDASTDEFHCARCGARQSIDTPQPVYLFVRAVDRFLKTHIDCEVPTATGGTDGNT